MTWQKLTPAVVGEIRVRAQAGEPKAALAREHGVHPTTVRYHTLHGKVLANPYADALSAAAKARRKGRAADAARFLRQAADILDPLPMAGNRAA